MSECLQQMSSRNLSLKRLKSLLRYEPETGYFIWIVSRGKAKKGNIAGEVRSSGYRRIRIDGEEYGAAPLAWFYMKGVWSELTIDHRNRDTDDNRWDNLREATRYQQNINRGLLSNNTSGVTGVKKERNKWRASIKRNGKMQYLGLYSDFEEAVAARKLAEVQDGEWAAIAPPAV